MRRRRRKTSDPPASTFIYTKTRTDSCEILGPSAHTGVSQSGPHCSSSEGCSFDSQFKTFFLNRKRLYCTGIKCHLRILLSTYVNRFALKFTTFKLIHYYMTHSEQHVHVMRRFHSEINRRRNINLFLFTCYSRNGPWEIVLVSIRLTSRAHALSFEAKTKLCVKASMRLL